MSLKRYCTLDIKPLGLGLVLCLFLCTSAYGQLSTDRIPSQDDAETKRILQSKKSLLFNHKDSLIQDIRSNRVIKGIRKQANKDSFEQHFASQKERTREEMEALDSNFTQLKEGYNDSLARMAGAKLVAKKEIINNEFAEIKSQWNFDSTQDHLAEKKKQITWSTFKPNLSGTLVSESYYTNFLDPFTRSELAYSRLYGSPSVDIAGLPFNMDFFVTTEDNSFYNSNYFRFQFDLNRYKQNVRKNLEDQLNKQLEEKKALGKDLVHINQEKKALASKVDTKKQELENLKSQFTEEQLKQDLDEKLKSNLDLEKRKAELKRRITSELQELIPDTAELRREIEQRLKDSLRGYSSDQRLTKIQDSIAKLQQQLEQAEELYSQAQETYTKLKQVDSLFSDSLANLRSQLQNPSFWIERGKKTKAYEKLKKPLESVKRLEFGLTQPYFSEYSLNGIPVKGLDIGLAFEHNDLDIAVGRTFRLEDNTFGLNQPQPNFTRNIIGINSKQKLGKKHSISIGSVSLFDNPNDDKRKLNTIHTLASEHKLGKKTRLNIQASHGWLNDLGISSPEIIIESGEEWTQSGFESRLAQFYNQLALETQAEIQLSRKLETELTYQRVNPGFITLGNPYLRSNFQELDAKVKAKIFNRKIRLTTFYKSFNDNITHLSSTTNQMQGYGIAARSNFKKSINFFVQHSPYQQGNNNPDTMFRTDNQLAVTTANLIYAKQFKGKSLTAVVSFVNSTVDFRGGQQQIANQMYMFNTSYSTKHLIASTTFTRNLAKPLVDTLNFYGLRIGINQLSSKKVNFSLNSFVDWFDSGAIRNQSILQARFNIKSKLEISLNGEWGYIHNIYGVENKQVYGGRMIMRYNL